MKRNPYSPGKLMSLASAVLANIAPMLHAFVPLLGMDCARHWKPTHPSWRATVGSMRTCAAEERSDLFGLVLPWPWWSRLGRIGEWQRLWCGWRLGRRRQGRCRRHGPAPASCGWPCSCIRHHALQYVKMIVVKKWCLSNLSWFKSLSEISSSWNKIYITM
jgi:hypothetical protein